MVCESTEKFQKRYHSSWDQHVDSDTPCLMKDHFSFNLTAQNFHGKG